MKLRDKLVKLAFENPSLRPHLLPLLSKRAARFARVSPQQVVGDIKRRTGFVAAVQTPKVKRSGLFTSKLNPYAVWVEYRDYAGESRDGGVSEFEAVLKAALDSGYTLAHNILNPNRIVGGAEALAWARKMRGIALVKEAG